MLRTIPEKLPWGNLRIVLEQFWVELLMEIPKEHVENPQVFFNNFGENPSLSISNDFLRNFKELSQQIQEEHR